METPSTPHRGTDSPRASLVCLTLVVLVTATAIILLLRPAGLTFSFSNTVLGSGVAATQSRALPPFSGVELAGVSSVTVHVGGEQRVVVHADDNLIRRVTTDVRSGTLVIAERGSFSTERPLSVDVTIPKLDRASLSGSGQVNVDGVQGHQFTASEMGSGTLTVAGVVHQLDASLSGSGNLQLQDLAAQEVTATLPGSGRIQVQVNGTLDASIPGSGAIIYSGHPTMLKQNVSGSGANSQALTYA